MDATPTTAQKYFDRRINDETIFVLPGNHFVQMSGQNSISTLLGSCVSACIRDTTSQAGGLNHFLLPVQDSSESNGQSMRYGVYAMEVLINDLLKSGSKKVNLQAKIFGGAKVISTSAATTVGTENSDFVREYLKSENIPIVAEDLGGDTPRRIYFYPHNGKVSVLKVVSIESNQIREREQEMRMAALKQKKSGDVELF